MCAGVGRGARLTAVAGERYSAALDAVCTRLGVTTGAPSPKALSLLSDGTSCIARGLPKLATKRLRCQSAHFAVVRTCIHDPGVPTDDRSEIHWHYHDVRKHVL